MPRNTRSASSSDADIGQRIRARRLELGLSQTDLAEKIGVTFQQVQKYEKGANRVGGGRLGQIAEVLSVPPSYFFASEDGKNGSDEKTEIFQLLSNGNAKAGIRILRAISQMEDSRLPFAIAVLCENIANRAAE
jgi:transcriptional regulator with XRE-family HTH domain